MIILDCTLRDGGYYNNWNFPNDITCSYLEAMAASGVNIVELGLRSLINKGFKGANAFTTDSYLDSLVIPPSLDVAVMINATELIGEVVLSDVLEILFPLKSEDSKVDIVRIACHVHEFVNALPASIWLKEKGYKVGFNLMQVADRSKSEIEALAIEAEKFPIDVLYFADSMGSMDPVKTSSIIAWLRNFWKGPIGIHTHDNMGLALSNSMQAIKDGVSWIDSTVTGMGRGPGNARTEELVIETAEMRKVKNNIVPLMNLIDTYFQPLKNKCGWGSNPYYYMAGKFGIHPTYIQEMLSDKRFTTEDIFSAIEQLKVEGGKKFTANKLDSSRFFYSNNNEGTWSPSSILSGKEILILGAGSGVKEHKIAIEHYVRTKKPIVMALNTQSSISQDLIDLRVACHPMRLLADSEAHSLLPQALVTPASILPPEVLEKFKSKILLDFGLEIKSNTFTFDDKKAVIPNSLVISYALAIAKSGKAKRILLAGFDGYGADDPRSYEMQHVINLYSAVIDVQLLSVTPTSYNLNTVSIYAADI